MRIKLFVLVYIPTYRLADANLYITIIRLLLYLKKPKGQSLCRLAQDVSYLVNEFSLLIIMLGSFKFLVQMLQFIVVNDGILCLLCTS